MFSLQKEAYDVLKESYRRRIAAALQEKGIGGSGALIFEGDSIEERILTLQDKKHALAAELIEENPKSMPALGEEELVGLFR